ncbi:MAG: nickel-responsive transcriptional regulator NikR [Candidatus Omnitrophica bacterium]|nr:nickel-responsive transcriptional regulator NikR [Candidatus Omnitrophota bacterium]
MANLIRFGVSLEQKLLQGFDSLLKEKKYSNRSEAIRDLIRESLVKQEWLVGKDVAGAITLVYDHHKRDLVNKILDIQHDFGNLIISLQHIHIDHNNCLELLAVKGAPQKVQNLSDTLRSVKGVRHCALSMSTTGRDLV